LNWLPLNSRATKSTGPYVMLFSFHRTS